MSTRNFAMLLGVVFLLVGILGFVPPLLTPPPTGAAGHELHVRQFDGYLLGLFHVNVLHSAVHVLFGILGIAMSRTYSAARGYCRFVAVAYGLLAVMGLIPQLNTVFGLIPIHGHDVWLHAAIALVSAYFGFAGPVETVTTTDTTTPVV